MRGSMIGALRVSLGLDSAQFEAGTKRLNGPIASMKAQFLAISAAAATLGAALGGITIAAARTATEISRLSQVSNTAPEVLQRWSAGARTVGIEQEKLSDILKDVNDRVGDFVTTGGGPMADFFEKVAPKIGITADAFRDLSGADALQLFVSSLEKANLSQAEMTFFMEAMASDSTLLLPLLKNNGAEMNRLGESAANLGAILSTETVGSLVRANMALGEVSLAFEGVRNRIATEFAPVLERMAVAFANSMREGGLLRTAIDGLIEAVSSALGVITLFAQNMEAVGVVIAGLVATQIPALIGALAAKALALGAAGAAAALATAAMTALNAAVMVLGGPIGLLAGAIGAAAAAFVIFGRDSKVAEQGAYNVAAAEAALSGELDVFSQSSNPAARNESRLRIIGLKQHAQAALATAMAELALAEAQQQSRLAEAPQWIKDANADGVLNTKEFDTASAKVTALMGQIKEMTAALKDMDLSGASGGVVATPLPIVPLRDDEGGSGKSAQGTGGGSDPFDQRLERLKTSLQTERETLDLWYQEQQEVLADRRSLEILGEEGHKAAMLAVEQEYQDRLAAIQQAAQAQRLGATASLFGSLAQIASAGGKRLAKVAAAAGAIEGTINSYVAATDALRKAPTIAGKFAAYASVLAAGLKGVAAIRAAGGVGGGGGASGGVGAVDARGVEPAQQPVQTMNFTIQNDPFGYGERIVRQLVTQLNEVSKNGGQIRGAVLT